MHPQSLVNSFQNLKPHRLFFENKKTKKRKEKKGDEERYRKIEQGRQNWSLCFGDILGVILGIKK